jgi:hypothetical protein
MRLALVATVIALMAPLISVSQEHPKLTVEALYGMCKEPRENLGGTFCEAYLGASVDQMVFDAVYGDRSFREGFAICGNVPSYAAAVQAFKNWAEKHPEEWRKPAVLGVIAALHDLWGGSGATSPQKK